MRHPRLKPAYRDTWHHCYNRAVGTAAELPFDDADKEQFVRILMRVAAFYAVQIVAYQVMSNHFHLLLLAAVTRDAQLSHSASLTRHKTKASHAVSQPRRGRNCPSPAYMASSTPKAGRKALKTTHANQPAWLSSYPI